MTLSGIQKQALGFFLKSMNNNPLREYFKKDLFTVFQEYEPDINPSIWGVQYREAMKSLPGEVKRQIVWSIVGNIKTEGLPSFMLSSLRTAIIADSPLIDGPTYIMLTIFANCLDFFPKELGHCYAYSPNPNTVEINFWKAKDDCSIVMETGEFATDFLMVYIHEPLLRAKFSFGVQPTPYQVDNIMRQLVFKDSVREQSPSLAPDVEQLMPTYMGPFSPALHLEFSGISYAII